MKNHKWFSTMNRGNGSMNTREITEEYRLSHWAGIMHRRQECGQSIKSYCKELGIHENVYYYWQRKLRAAACVQMTETTALTAPTSLPRPGAGMLRVTVNGMEIVSDAGYPIEALTKLLRALSEPC